MVVELYLRWLCEPSLCMVGRGPVIRALSLLGVVTSPGRLCLEPSRPGRPNPVALNVVQGVYVM